MKQVSPPLHLDLKTFAHSASSIAGVDALSKYGRLMIEMQGIEPEMTLRWAARGELGSDPSGAEQVWLHLSVDTCLPLTCQRCLGRVDIAVAAKQSYRFVGNEEEAQAQDEESEEDVMVLSRDFNLAELIENEVLMALPLIPRHETCPIEVKMAVADEGFELALTEKRKPFAMLSKLQADKSV